MGYQFIISSSTRKAHYMKRMFLNSAPREVKDPFLKNLTNEDLYLMVLYYQKERARYLKEFFLIVERQCSLERVLGEEVKEYEEEKTLTWRRYEACETLIEECLAQTSQRLSKP